MKGMLEYDFPIWFFKLPRIIELQDFNFLASKTIFESPKKLNSKTKTRKNKIKHKNLFKNNLKLTKKLKKGKKIF